MTLVSNGCPWRDGITTMRHARLPGDLAVDVAVVGAGVTGLTTALHLRRAGRSVAVIEAHRVASGNTSLSTAHLTEVLDTRWHTLVSRFGLEPARLAAASQRAAIDQIGAIVREEGIDCGLAAVPGYLFCERPEHRDEIEREAAAMRQVGLSPALLDAIPLPFAVERALRLDGQAQLDPLRYAAGLAAALQRAGGMIFEDTRAMEVDEGTVCRLVTEHGEVRATDVVVAAHVPVFHKVLLQTKLAPYRTYAIALPAAEAATSGLFWDTEEPYHYVRHAAVGGHDVWIVGGEDHKVGHPPDHDPFEALARWGKSRLRVGPTHRWSGQVNEPADGLPYIGPGSSGGHVWVASGFSGNGITQGTLAAMILSQSIAGHAGPWQELYDATRVHPLAAAGRFVTENVDFPVELVVGRLRRASALAEVGAGEGRVVQSDGHTLAVFRDDEGELHAVSAVCTHLGCLVRWNGAERSWDCPCHGSRFDPSGAVLEGPTVRPLAPHDLGDHEEEVSAKSTTRGR